jgi:hypothetical protein
MKRKPPIVVDIRRPWPLAEEQNCLWLLHQLNRATAEHESVNHTVVFLANGAEITFRVRLVKFKQTKRIDAAHTAMSKAEPAVGSTGTPNSDARFCGDERRGKSKSRTPKAGATPT